MKPCFKILGQGAQGITYLTPENIVVKVEPVRKKILKDGDKFGLEIVPKLPNEIKKHFTQYYSVEFYDENPLENLKCITDNSIFRYFKKTSFASLNFPKSIYFKVTTMENAGSMFAESVLTNAKMPRMYFEQLYIPVCAMNYMGYFHKDLHTQNVMFDGETFKIIDYGLMKKLKSFSSDINRLTEVLYFYRIDFTRKAKNKLYFDFDNLDDMEQTCINEIKVPEKYKSVEWKYRMIFHSLELEKCEYLNDDLEIIPVHKDKVYDDEILIELIRIASDETNYLKMVNKIQKLISHK